MLNADVRKLYSDSILDCMIIICAFLFYLSVQLLFSS